MCVSDTLERYCPPLYLTLLTVFLKSPYEGGETRQHVTVIRKVVGLSCVRLVCCSTLPGDEIGGAPGLYR